VRSPQRLAALVQLDAEHGHLRARLREAKGDGRALDPRPDDSHVDAHEEVRLRGGDQTARATHQMATGGVLSADRAVFY